MYACQARTQCKIPTESPTLSDCSLGVQGGGGDAAILCKQLASMPNNCCQLQATRRQQQNPGACVASFQQLGKVELHGCRCSSAATVKLTISSIQCLTARIASMIFNLYAGHCVMCRCARCLQCSEQGLLFQVKDVVHRAREGQLQGGAGNVAIMWGPPPVHATPQLWHDQCAVQAVGNGHSCSHLHQHTC